MSHLETLIAEYLDWEGFLVKRNIKVGRLSHGGWEGELDIVGYHPTENRVVHYEPSVDALSWDKREARTANKFEAGKKYIFKEVFPWLKVQKLDIEQIAVFVSHPHGRDQIAGGRVYSVDEIMRTIRDHVVSEGILSKNAIPEQYPLLRTIQLSHCGYHRVL